MKYFALLILVLAVACHTQPKVDLLLLGGRVVDPTSDAPPRDLDIAMDDGKIVAIGEDLRTQYVAAETIDARLDDGLADRVEAELLERVLEEVEREVEPWRARLPADQLDAARRRGVARRLRRRLGLPRLAAPGAAS